MNYPKENKYELGLDGILDKYLGRLILREESVNSANDLWKDLWRFNGMIETYERERKSSLDKEIKDEEQLLTNIYRINREELSYNYFVFLVAQKEFGDYLKENY